MNKELFAERLVALRKQKGYENQNQLAAAYNREFPPKRKDDSEGNTGSGILGTIKHYENPNYLGSPKLDKVDNICDLLGCDIDYLTGRIDYKTHNLEYISEYTGLSEEAVEIISTGKSEFGEPSLETQFIDALLTSTLFKKRFLKTMIDLYLLKQTAIKGIRESQEATYSSKEESDQIKQMLQDSYKAIRFSILDYSDACLELLYSLLDIKQIMEELQNEIDSIPRKRVEYLTNKTEERKGE